MSLFEDIAADWHPADQEATEVVGTEGPEFFSALLDQPNPVVKDGDPLPPLWHWFMFLPVYPQSEIGGDGHPRDAAFTPPIPDRRRMFGGGRVSVTAPLRCGDEVVKRSSATSIRAKEGGSGPLLLVTVRSEFSVDGTVRLVEEQDIVYLQAKPAVGKPPEPPSGATPPDAQWRLTLDPDPTLLFRFSSLTRNAHRIHYDREYATGVEGHRGLVVHGPLLGLLMLELPRRFAPALSLETLSWRLKAPTFDHQRIEVFGDLDGSTASLRTGADGKWESVTGTAVFSEEAVR